MSARLDTYLSCYAVQSMFQAMCDAASQNPDPNIEGTFISLGLGCSQLGGQVPVVWGTQGF